MKRIGIVGAGRFGGALATTLCERGAEVILLDRSQDMVKRMAPVVAKAAQGDGTDVQALTAVGFQDCDVAVVAIGNNMEGSILAAMNLQEMEVPYLVAKATTEMHGRVLDRIGVNLVVYPNKELAQRLARSLLARSPLEYFEVSDGVGVAEMEAPPGWVGKTLSEAEVRQQYGITVLAIKRAKHGKSRSIITPSANDCIEKGDILVIFGLEKKLVTIE